MSVHASLLGFDWDKVIFFNTSVSHDSRQVDPVSAEEQMSCSELVRVIRKRLTDQNTLVSVVGISCFACFQQLWATAYALRSAFLFTGHGNATQCKQLRFAAFQPSTWYFFRNNCSVLTWNSLLFSEYLFCRTDFSKLFFPWGNFVSSTSDWRKFSTKTAVSLCLTFPFGISVYLKGLRQFLRSRISAF